MHKTKKLAALLLALAMVFAFAACGESETTQSPAPTESVQPTEAAEPSAESSAEASVWDNAQYTEDTELGEGAMTVSFECTAEERTVTFTVHTDAENLRDALEGVGLISGDESEFGMYVKSVNGMSADYEADGFYWALYIDGAYAPTGADTTPVTDGMNCAFVREAA